MRRSLVWSLFVLLIFGSTIFANATSSGDLRILTFPVGLVVGEIPVDVDLGPSAQPADLYLDGQPVCSLTADKPQCTIDVGASPHVHLLELVRTDDNGNVIATASSWINRPGQEADLAIQLGGRTPEGVCDGRVLWFHPLKQAPVFLEVTLDGRGLKIVEGGGFRFPCRDPKQPQVLAASSIFPDGRRAEAVAVTGGFAGHAEAGLTAVAVTGGVGESPCADFPDSVDSAVKPVVNENFEVVFVLDPSAGYGTLYRSGWSKSTLNSTNQSSKQFDQLVQQGAKGSEPKPKNTWKRAYAALVDAEKMWLVAPNEELQRANGFAQGRLNWMELLFQVGSTKLEGKPYVADAVAASGLVAAASPRRRAVALILGSKASRDVSQFSPQEAQAYLAEVGVPLYVLRNGKLRDDGWPEGLAIKNMEGLANAFETIRGDLQNQCVFWFPGSMHPSEIAASLPESFEIAGRQGPAAVDAEAVWQQAAITAAPMLETPPANTVPGEDAEFEGELVDVTAVTVLFKARDAQGAPITDLSIDDVEVTEDEISVAVLGVEQIVSSTTAPPPVATQAADQPPPNADETTDLPVSIFINRELSGSTEITPSLKALAQKADWITSLGPVEIIDAGQSVEVALSDSRDPATVRNTLEQLADKPSGKHTIEQIRTRFIRDIRKAPRRMAGPSDMENDDDPYGSFEAAQAGENQENLERAKLLTAARGAIFEEDSVLRHAADRVRNWALEQASAEPRVLVVVGAGFDEDPVEFYLPFVERTESQNAGRAYEDFKRFRQSERVNEVGTDLAAAGWLVVPVASRTAGSTATTADSAGGDRFQDFLSAAADTQGTRDAEWLLLNPLASQQHLAAPSGGEVAVGPDGLDKLEADSAGWYRLTYQADRSRDGKTHNLAISTSRPNTTVKSTSVIASETFEGQAAARVRRLLDGSEETADLNIELEVGPSQSLDKDRMTAEATTTIDLSPISALLHDGGRRPLRVSVGVEAGENPIFILHRTEALEGAVDLWRYSIPLQWPKGPAKLAIVVEDLGSGAWGGVVQELR